MTRLSPICGHVVPEGRTLLPHIRADASARRQVLAMAGFDIQQREVAHSAATLPVCANGSASARSAVVTVQRAGSRLTAFCTSPRIYNCRGIL
jgi:hypothetical protein